MYLLVATHRSPEWEGEIAREFFEEVAAAEARMARWARFGVDSFCNTPSDIWIFGDDGQPVRIWDWRTRAPVEIDRKSENTERQE